MPARAQTARYAACPALFDSELEYESFRARHARAKVETLSRPGYAGKVYVGIDAGSTTIKAVVIDEEYNLLKTAYLSNKGDPLPAVRRFLTEFYEEYPDATVAGAGSTGALTPKTEVKKASTPAITRRKKDTIAYFMAKGSF